MALWRSSMTQTADKPELPGTGIRVLIVDDDEAHAQAVAESLERVGYECTVAGSGEKGLSLIEKETYDVVVTDLRMGEIDGLTLLRRTKEELPDAEVILLTGHASVQSALDSGKVKLIAIGTEKRAASFPDLPTVAESGLPGFAMYATVGILAPAGTPADIIAKVNAAAAVAVSSPEVKKKLEGLGVTVAPSSTAQFDATIKGESKKFDRLVKLSGAQVD